MRVNFLLSTSLFLLFTGISYAVPGGGFKRVVSKNATDTFNPQEIKEELTFEYIHIHAFGDGKNSCLYCHKTDSPSKKDVKRVSGELVCYECHREVYERIDSHLYHHKNIRNCVMCHDPHQSDNIAMLKGDGITVCMRCHATNKAGYCVHPQGEKHLDPRNGQPVTCISCHFTMGTDYKYLLKKNGESALCYQCHSPKRYK
ncbi:cytochrome c3 family protein [Desulfurobacterium atlanticum]|uniref:Doubled CXXCH domain-containing protein n=1 Tax=Desulfurobacterium atlanticum TaxID=240169 RepID=A0A238YGM6_9BACT|nr:cytochrome c3 family protein [Desulfurobacterium atlanticum]SNR70396.1 doubled CXXCH domain-containing protein [Desulfurobacterium atlanticum]